MRQNIFWHDGTLDTLRVKGPTRRTPGSIELDVSLYPTNQSAARSKYTLVCGNVSALQLTADMVELHDNAGAGNIEDGLIQKSSEGWEADLRLVRGRFRVKCKTMRLKKRVDELQR
jgi:hypothetical protein